MQFVTRAQSIQIQWSAVVLEVWGRLVVVVFVVVVVDWRNNMGEAEHACIAKMIRRLVNRKSAHDRCFAIVLAERK